METEKLFQDLLRLNYWEKAGRDYFQICGEELSYLQLYYLVAHPNLDNPVEALLSPAVISENQVTRRQFRETYPEGLTAQGFIPEGTDIEIEKLDRYVHIPRHKHDFLELVCVLNGTCTHSIGEQQFTHCTGDFTIIPPSVEHELHASEDCICLTTKIRTASFLKIFSDLLSGNSLLSAYFSQALNLPYYRCALTMHSGEDAFVRETMLTMLWQQKHGLPYSEKMIEGLWGVLFSYLLQNYQDTSEFLVSNHIQRGKMVEILSYIFENYQDITLQETARHFYMSVPYLSTKIHKATGKTFSELLRSYKLQKASELLTSTDQKLDWICGAVGYKDTAQFVRAFRNAYGMTPSQYRKSHRSA